MYKYEMPKDSNIEKIFETLQGYPLEDPVQLYGLNVNHLHTASYEKSRSLMNYTLKAHDLLAGREKAMKDSSDLQQSILMQRVESGISETLGKYTQYLQGKISQGHEQHIKLIEYSTQLLTLYPLTTL